MTELDNEELERLCKICVENGISTGHADTLAEFAGECVTNLLDMRMRLTILEAQVPKWIDEDYATH